MNKRFWDFSTVTERLLSSTPKGVESAARKAQAASLPLSDNMVFISGKFGNTFSTKKFLTHHLLLFRVCFFLM